MRIKDAFNIHYGIVFRLPRKIAKPILSLFYPLVKLIFELPKVLTIEETLFQIASKRISIVRFGDGELQYIVHKLDLKYQEYDENLANKLRKILLSKNNNILIGLPDCYRSVKDFEFSKKIYWRAMVVLYYPGFKKFIDVDKQYANANITRLYYGYKDKAKASNRFIIIKNLFAQRKILLIEGEKSRLGVGNDLFSNADHVKRILGPPHHAFRQLEKLKNEAQKFGKEYLILVALGTGGKPLVFDLACMGYQVLDIGNLDLEYEWFKRGVKERILIPGKYVSEVAGGRVVTDVYDDVYNSQIIAKFLND